VGSSIALSLKHKYPTYRILVFDNLHRRGSELNLNRLLRHQIEFVHGDIRIPDDFNAIGSADLIIDASAEPSVLAGVTGSSPDYVVSTNLVGTVNVLNHALKMKANFIFLSTSRVYPINRMEKISIKEEAQRVAIDGDHLFPGLTTAGINEQFPLEGFRSIYGATKLASELLIQEYNHFFGMKTVINRCGVLTGPWQMGKVDQGFAVLWMAKHFWKGELAYIGFNGNGKQVRDILHVYDLFRLLDKQIHSPESFNGEIFNIGGGLDNSVSLKQVTEICVQMTGNVIRMHEIKETRQADIPLYITDNSKITRHSGWKPEIGLQDIFRDIYTWIRENSNDLEPILR